MNKKGFVLIETIVVMSIVMISLIGIYGTYSSIVKNQSQRKFYDNINDVYRLNIIKGLLKEEFLNSTNLVVFENTNCIDSGCNTIIDELVEDGTNIEIIIVPSNVDLSEENALLEGKQNSLRRYFKTIDADGKNIIVLRYIKDENEYFSSLEV